MSLCRDMELISDPTVEDLVELPLRVAPQPDPCVSPGGDCGACVLAGLLGLPHLEVYSRLHPEGKPVPFSRAHMASALQTACTEGLLDRFVTETPHWHQWSEMRAWGDAGWVQWSEWREWLMMAFDAGYYAIAQVATHPIRAITERAFETDHWVLYCGVRTKWDGPEGNRKKGEFELLVSDSNKTRPREAWLNLPDHLVQRGGFNALLARPARARPSDTE